MDDEARWIKNASQSAVMYAEPYNGDGYKYDFVSMYPSTLSRQKNMYPIKRGQFMKITNDEFINKPLKFGIYRCVIEKSQGSNKYFRFNDNDHYAVKDIITARNYNLKVNLIEDDQPNFLYYSDDCCLAGSQLFGEYVKTLFSIKQKGNKLAKEILNCLWGVLCQNNYKHHKLDHKTKEVYDIMGDNVLDELCPNDEDNTATKITYHSQNSIYCNRYARICPFVLSNGRYLLGVTIKPHIDTLVHVHTDGFISTVPLDLKTGLNIGDIKFEGNDNLCVVEAINKVKFN